MNILIMLGFLLGAGVIAYDHLVDQLPHWLAVTLYSIAVLLFIIGMAKSRK